MENGAGSAEVQLPGARNESPLPGARHKVPTAGPASVKIPAFVHSLWEIVNSSKYQHLIHFSSDGDAVIVEDERRLRAEVLPHYFTQHNPSSFQRQLNFYSFVRVDAGIASAPGSNRAIYEHPHFRRDQPEQLLLIIRKTNHRAQRAGVQVTGGASSSASVSSSVAGITSQASTTSTTRAGHKRKRRPAGAGGYGEGGDESDTSPSSTAAAAASSVYSRVYATSQSRSRRARFITDDMEMEPPPLGLISTSSSSRSNGRSSSASRLNRHSTVATSSRGPPGTGSSNSSSFSTGSSSTVSDGFSTRAEQLTRRPALIEEDDVGPSSGGDGSSSTTSGVAEAAFSLLAAARNGTITHTGANGTDAAVDAEAQVAKALITVSGQQLSGTAEAPATADTTATGADDDAGHQNQNKRRTGLYVDTARAAAAVAAPGVAAVADGAAAAASNTVGLTADALTPALQALQAAGVVPAQLNIFSLQQHFNNLTSGLTPTSLAPPLLGGYLSPELPLLPQQVVPSPLLGPLPGPSTGTAGSTGTLTPQAGLPPPADATAAKKEDTLHRALLRARLLSAAGVGSTGPAPAPSPSVSTMPSPLQL